MNFSSIIFVFGFLPAVFLLHTIIPNIKIKNYFLAIASLFFYAWGEPIHIILMIVSVFINWLLSAFIARKDKCKIFIVIAVIVNIGLLTVFKYSGFIVESINLLGTNLPVPEIHLPIGISFYTFQAMSYVIDVYRDKTTFQKSFVATLLYIAFFPQLIAGPIVKYHDINKQLSDRRVTIDGVSSGIRRFIIGLSKKLLLADVAALTVDTIFASDTAQISGFCAWTGAIFYIFQIYFDFSGYSDMAIGLAKMFGFDLLENFNYPYISKSITEFWRRWHISLSTWFREYLYIPLGGNRKGTLRTYVNLFIVFLATGIWHGANFTFLVWGIYNGILMILERCKVIRIKNRVISHIYTLIAVTVGFVIFRADSIGYAIRYLSRMVIPSAFTYGGADALEFFNPYFIVSAIAMVIGCIAIVPKLRVLEEKKTKIGKILSPASYVASLVLFLICFGVLASNSYSPFIYFRF